MKEVEEAVGNEEEEDDDEDDILTQKFDGSKRINVGIELVKVKDKHCELFVSRVEFERKFKQLENNVNAELLASLTAMEEAHNERFAALEDSIKINAINNSNATHEINDWTLCVGW